MQEHKREKQIGNTLFTVISECSPSATETVDQKLMRILNRHIADAGKASECYPDRAENCLLCVADNGNIPPNTY